MKKTYFVKSGGFNLETILLHVEKEKRVYLFKRKIEGRLFIDFNEINEDLLKYGFSLKKTIKILKDYGFTYINESKRR